MAVAVVLAGGKGERVSSVCPKQFVEIQGQPLLAHTLKPFQESDWIHSIYIVLPFQFKDEKDLGLSEVTKLSGFIEGGATRFDSSFNAISFLEDQVSCEELILIHDACRPFVSHRLIQSVVSSLSTWRAVNVFVPVRDTTVQLFDKQSLSFLDRSSLRAVQTPQGFIFSDLYRSYQKAVHLNSSHWTDDWSLVYEMCEGQNCGWVEGDSKNFKITYSEDLKYAELLLKS